MGSAVSLGQLGRASGGGILLCMCSGLCVIVYIWGVMGGGEFDKPASQYKV